MAESKVKKGLKTSEFYVALIASIVPVLNAHLGLNIPVEALITIGGIAISYILGRSVVKKSA